MMPHDHSALAELEAALAQGSESQRFTILRRVIDLFLANAESYTEEHVAVFDVLVARLIEKIERQALVELSGRLAPVDNAPVNVIGRLSRDDDIEISGPVLERSNVLTDGDLVEIAKTKSQAHLSAIAGRARIGEPITDVLIDRGDSDVACKVTTNTGARFSSYGFSKAVSRAEQDDNLALAVANRIDLPPEMFAALVRKATTAVRERLMANAGPDMRERITQVLSEVSDQVARSGATALRRDPSRLNAQITEGIETGNSAELIDALAGLCDIPVKAVSDLVRQSSDEGVLLLGKFCGMRWPELQGVVKVIMPEKTKSADEITALFAKFRTLSAANAERAVRFIRSNAARAADDLRRQL
jgi:uncharacterized protein (DUF2336 family)